MWRLYLQDERDRVGSLVQESAKRLAGDDLDDVVMKELRPKGEDGEEVEAGPVEKIFDSCVAAAIRQLAQIHHPLRHTLALDRTRRRRTSRAPPRAVAPP